MSWIEVRTRFDQLPDDLSPIIEAYRDHGIENTLEDGLEVVGCIVDVPSTSDCVTDLRKALLELGATEVIVHDLVEVDWTVAWKQFFKPRRVGSRIVVRPTWEEFEVGATDVEIVLDPGQAFGTGDHPTTRLCLELLDATNLTDRSVLDLGCGSGILAIAALKLGASAVHAVDSDPIAADVTRENMKLNACTLEVSVADRLDRRSYDVIVSNIISATLIRLAVEVSKAVRRGGHWIVSGIIEANWPDVRESAEATGFTLDEERHEDGWVAARFSKP